MARCSTHSIVLGALLVLVTFEHGKTDYRGKSRSTLQKRQTEYDYQDYPAEYQPPVTTERPKFLLNIKENDYQDYGEYQPPARAERPIIVQRKKENDYQDYPEYEPPATTERPKFLLKKKEKQDFSKIPGEPWVDYPIFHVVPQTKFSCAKVPALPGMYANVETGCQAYHVCHDGREGDQGASFLCANGTIFNQEEFNCDWWYNVNCADALKLYSNNLNPEKNPYVPQAHKEAIRREKLRIVVL